MNIPFIDFSEQYQAIKEDVNLGLKEVFQKGNFILGQPEKDFEAAFAKYCGVQFAAGVNSGTDALHLALSSLNIGSGDEVILPAFTFIATALGVSFTGAKPVFVDVEEETCNIDPEKLKAVVTDKTKAIMPVHLYGQAANMTEITSIAKENGGIAVIEDAAQAHGAAYQGKKAGSLGDAACFSFYPTKGLGAFGDGGIVVTDNKEIYEGLLMLRDYGRQGRYEHIIKGFNSRLDTVQAVVLAAKLPYLDEWNKMRSDNAAYYCELLKNTGEVKTPVIREGRTHVFQTFAVRVKDRDEVCQKMQEKGIVALIHYPIPVHLQKAYTELGYKKGDFPVSEQLSDEVLSLPMFPHMKKEQIEYVCEILKEASNKSACFESYR